MYKPYSKGIFTGIRTAAIPIAIPKVIMEGINFHGISNTRAASRTQPILRKKMKETLSLVPNTACFMFQGLDRLFFHYLKRMACKAFPGAQGKNLKAQSSCF